MHRYLSYRSVLKRRFGAPVLKVPLSGGFSCPNRDGTKSTEGCHFCDNRSFSPAALLSEVPAVEQLNRQLAKHGKRPPLLLPYLQPFSNTYGTVEKLRKVYEPLLEVDGVIGIAVGTRPDCFSEDIYRYLADLAKRTYLSMELGLQSVHDVTLAACNRGHTFEEFCTVVTTLSRLGIETVAHVMLGLPGEDKQMMMQTARALAALPCTGVKIHQLMIIEETIYASMYRSGNARVLSLKAYCDLLLEFMSYLRPDQQIHRIVANASVENGLIAPRWSADKMGSLQTIQTAMNEIGFMQGSRYNRCGTQVH